MYGTILTVSIERSLNMLLCETLLVSISRDGSYNCVHGTHHIFNFKQHNSDNAAPFFFYFTNVETTNKDKLGEEYIAPIKRVTLETVVEDENSDDVFGEALDNIINNFHHTVDAGLKNMASGIKSAEKSSKFHHRMVMQGLSALVTKRDNQKSMKAIMPEKKRNTGPGLTMGIHPRTLCPTELMTNGSDTANTTSDYDEDTVGDETVEEETVGE
jgi:hypothetical protein